MQDRRTAALAWSNKPLTMPVLPPESKIREEGRMKYYNARSALPEPLFREVQRYVERDLYVYLLRPNTPAGRGIRRAPGARGAQRRNPLAQAARHVRGELAERFCLSVYAIRKIIYGK